MLISSNVEFCGNELNRTTSTPTFCYPAPHGWTVQKCIHSTSKNSLNSTYTHTHYTLDDDFKNEMWLVNMEVNRISNFPKQQCTWARVHRGKRAFTGNWSHPFSASNNAINGKRSAMDHRSFNMFFASCCNSAERGPCHFITVILKQNNTLLQQSN